MDVVITAKISVRKGGEVVLRHEAAIDDVTEQVSVFGVPGRKLSNEEAQEIVQNLESWVRERFEIEVKAALNAIKRQEKK